MTDILTRDEVERRLAEVAPANLDDYQNYRWCREREALQTAQSLYAERDAQTERHKGEIVTCLRAMDGLEAERDALRAEGIGLREALQDMLSGWVYVRQHHDLQYGVGWERAQNKAEAALALPLTTAAADSGPAPEWKVKTSPCPECAALRARVAALEAVAEAAKDTIMWAGEVCPEWPSMKHQDCAEHCGNRRVCAALAALDRGRA